MKTKTTEQVRQWYSRTWTLYCAVRLRQEHTGGGDGDQFRIDDAGLASIQEDLNDNKPSTDTNKDQPSKRQFSTNQLDTFEDSKLFQLLDGV